MRPVLIEGARGALAGFYHPPQSGIAGRGDLLIIAAFAEEMNRCRSMVTMQAQAFAGVGIGSLVLDGFGTGDSAGEFEQADWELWREDLKLGMAWLEQHGQGCQGLWGLRLGALMAAELAVAHPSIKRLLLWQPVVAGKPYWTQFLRIRIAAEMSQADGVKSTEALRQMSLQGQSVEASGYAVGSALAQQLDRLVMPAGELLADRRVEWLEVQADGEAPLPRASSKCVDAWRAADVDVHLTQVPGPAFWQVHERDVAPALIAASTAAARTWTLTKPTRPAMAGPQCKGIEVATAPEYPLTFRCADVDMAGVIHRGRQTSTMGVVIVVAGGPQYRVGAHRQFVSLARVFAAQGYPVLRFDLRGMGDSGGEYRGYHHSRDDIRAAIDALMAREPQLQHVMLFGECESATGILFYAGQDSRVRQIALANPWVRTSEGQAEVILKHYYADRLRSPEFWRHVLTGKFRLGAAIGSFFSTVSTYLQGRKSLRAAASQASLADFDGLPLPKKTAEGLRRYSGPVLLLMSGHDYIAREFDEVTKSSQAWAGLLADPRVRRKDIAGADHTFSKPEWKAEAHHTLLTWLAQPHGGQAG